MARQNKVIIYFLLLYCNNCTTDKMDWDGENKIQGLYGYFSNYALSKLIVDNGFEDL